MLPQPLADTSLPSPSEEVLRSRQKWWWIRFNCVLSMILVVILVLLGLPMAFHRPRRADQTQAVSNARQIGLALVEFQSEYGSFPDFTTISAVREKTLSDLDLGTRSSNDFFRQLLASDIAQSEIIFYAKTNDSQNPDGIFTKGEALKAKECGFTYLLGTKITDSPSRPIVVTPMIPGTDRFDPKPFDGKAVVLRLDISVSSYRIDKDGHVMIDGRNMMDPHHPIWGDHAPAIAWPE